MARALLPFAKKFERSPGFKYWVAVLGAVLYVKLFRQEMHRPDFSDLAVYLEAGRKALAHHTVYDIQGHYQYKYAPFVSLLFGIVFSPFSSLEILGWTLYFILFLSWTFFAASIYRQVTRQNLIFGVGVFLIVFGTTLRDELKLGQINLIPVFLSCWIFRDERHLKDRPVLSGLCLALAVQFKLYTLPFFAIFILRKNWKAVLSFLISGFILNFGIVALWSGFEFSIRENLAWVASLTASTAGLLDSKYNVSIFGFLLKHSVLIAQAKAIWMVLCATLGVLFILLRNQSNLFLWAWLSTAVCLVNPIVWPYWLMLTLPAVYLTSERLIRKNTILGVLFLAAMIRVNWIQNNESAHLVWIFASNLFVTALLTHQGLTKNSDALLVEASL